VDEPLGFGKEIRMTYDDERSEDPIILRDHAGKTHVLYQDREGGSFGIFSTEYDEDEIISHGRTLVFNNGTSAVRPDAAIDLQDNMHIVWQDDRDGNQEIYYLKLDRSSQIVVPQKRLTTNTFTSKDPKIEIKDNILYITWIDDRSGAPSVHVMTLDMAGNTISQERKIDSDQVVSFAAYGDKVSFMETDGEMYLADLSDSNSTIKIADNAVSVSMTEDSLGIMSIIWQKNDDAIYLTRMENNQLLEQKIIASPGEAAEITADVDMDNRLHIVYTLAQSRKAHYSRLDTDGYVLVDDVQISDDYDAKEPYLSALGDDVVDIAWTASIDDENNEIIILTSGETDSSEPTITDVLPTLIRSYSMTIIWKTDEPCTSKLEFGRNESLGMTIQNLSLKKDHRIVLYDLDPAADYYFKVASEDLFRNKKTADADGSPFHTKTRNTTQQPEMPSTIYGRVLYQNQTPAERIKVVASWIDSDASTHNTERYTIDTEEANDMGNMSLLGFYLFNTGRIKAKDGTSISLSAAGMINGQNPTIVAAPGGDALFAENIIIDTTPPKIIIHSPVNTAYDLPSITLRFTASEALSRAEYSINGGEFIEATSLVGTDILVNARDGENNITVIAKDMVGLRAEASITFEVYDSVPPAVAFNPPTMVSKDILLVANVSDATNSLKIDSCEVCRSSDGVCTTWSPAQSDFGSGDQKGTCSFSWLIAGEEDGDYYFAFRVKDISENIGTSNIKEITIDRTAPGKIAWLNVTPVSGKPELSLLWSRTEATDFSEYHIYRSTSDFDSVDSQDVVMVAVITQVFTTHYIDIGLESETAYYYAVTAIDSAGNEDGTVDAMKGDVPDVIGPNITIMSPEDRRYGTSMISAEFEADEETALCYYKLNNDSRVYGIDREFDINVDEGTYHLTIGCEDTSGNTGEDSISFVVDLTSPDKISGLSVRAVQNENSLEILWDISSAEDFSAYNIYRSLSAFDDVTDAELVSTVTERTAVRYRDEGLESQTTYHYAVTAVDDVANEDISVVSKSAIVGETEPPAKVQGLTVNTMQGQIMLNLSWTANVENDLSHYRIYRKDAAFNNVSGLTPLTTTQDTKYLDVSVNNARTYYYAVTAVDWAENENTTVISVMGDVDDILPPIITISSPQEKYYDTATIPLAFTLDEPADCTYSFNSADQVYVSPDQQVTLDAIEGENGLYMICIDAKGNLANKTIDFDVDTKYPSQILGLNVTHVAGEKTMRLAWITSDISDFSRYKIYRSYSPFDDVSDATYLAGITEDNSVIYLDEDLKSETTYHYAVTQEDQAGHENSTVTSVSEYVPDLDAPLVTILSPKDGFVYNNSDLLVDFTTSENSTCRYMIDDGTEVPISEAQMVHFSDGDISLKIECADHYQNAGSATIGFIVDTIAPVDITGLRARTISGSAALGLSWDKIMDPGFYSYMIYRADSAFTDVSDADVIKVIEDDDLTNYTDTGLVSGATYYYAVTAKDKAGNMDTTVVSVSGVVADIVPPAKITGLVVTPSSQGVSLRLDWNRSTETDFWKYKIYKKETDYIDSTLADIVAEMTNKDVTFYIDTQVESEKKYYYAVAAVDTFGNEDDIVNTVVGIPPDTKAPVVTILTPYPIKYNALNISLRFMLSEEANCSYTINDDTPVQLESTQEIIMAHEGTNAFEIVCFDFSGNKGNDSVVFNVDTHAPGKVTGLAAGFDSADNKVELSWDASPETDFSFYRLYRSDNDFTNVEGMQPLQMVPGTWTTTTDGGVASETTYYYAVTPIDSTSNENKDVDAVRFDVPDFLAPAKITGLSVQHVTGEFALDLSWNPSGSDDIAEYRIYRSASAFIDKRTAQQIGTAESSTTSYRDSGLLEETTYHYAVTAVDETGNEDWHVTSASGKTADLNAPEITIHEPVDGELYQQQVHVRWEATEEPRWCGYMLNERPEQTLPLTRVTCMKYLGGYDFVNNDADPYDDHGHGTHCSGIAAGNGGQIVGVAPGAQLLAYKVLDASGHGSWTSILAAMEQAIEDDADIISMSLGTTAPGSPDDYPAISTDAIADSDIVTVIAAGNLGYTYGDASISSPGTSRKAITVGSVTKSLALSYFSSQGPTTAGPKPDIVAPGSNIYSSLPGNRYASWSGTSMATPHVAGVAALLLQKNPGWGNSDVKAAIKNNAVDLGMSINLQGAGLIDAVRAMTNAGPGVPTQGTPNIEAAPSSDPTLVMPAPVVMTYAPDEKRRIIIELDEESVLSKVSKAPAGLPESSKRNIEDQQMSVVERSQKVTEDALGVMGHTVSMRYKRIMNGLVTEADKAEIEAIRSLPGVKGVHEDVEVSLSLADSVPLINADDVWQMTDDLGRLITGKGVKIAIIDTGIDYNHPAFQSAACGIEYEAYITADDGQNDLAIYCNDTFDNKGTSEHVIFNVDLTGPGHIENLSITPFGNMQALNLDWQETTASDFAFYSVYRSDQPFTTVQGMVPLQVIYIKNESYYADLAVYSEQTYHYAVTATDTSGNEDHDVVSVPGTVNDFTPPGRVAGLLVKTIKDAGQLDLSWNSNTEPDIAGYNIYHSNSAFASILDATRIAQVDALTYAYSDIDLTAGSTHHYAVTAYDQNGNERLDVVSVPGMVDDMIRPSVAIATPESGKLYTENPVALSWTVSKQPSWCGYILNQHPMATLSISGCQPSGTEYLCTESISADEGQNQIIVSCNDSIGHSGQSGQIAFSVDSISPNPILGLTVSTVQGELSLDLSWQQSDATDFAGYRIYRSDSSFSKVEGEWDEGEIPDYGTLIPTTGLLHQRTDHAATVLADGRILVVGGYWASALFGRGPLDATLLITPPAQQGESGTRVYGPHMYSDRRNPSIITLKDGRVLVVGGTDGSGPVSSSEIYNPIANNFTLVSGQGCTMHIERKGQTMTLLDNGKVLVAGGYYDGGTLRSAELFDPATNCFTYTGDMTEFRGDHQAVKLKDGRVFLIGAAIAKSGDVYDPATGTFRATKGNMTVRRTRPAATLLDDGRVLIVGGYGSSSPLDTAEIYDPTTDTFTMVSDTLSVPRSSAIAHVVENGKVIIVAGFTGTGDAVKQVDIYDPATDTFELGTISLLYTNHRFGYASAVFPDGRLFISGGDQAGTYNNEMYYPPGGSSSWSSDTIELIDDVADVSAVAYRDTGLISDKTYHYAVTAYDINDNENKDVISVAGTVIDITGPMIMITSPSASKTYTSTDVALSFSTDEPAQCTYSLNFAGPLPATDGIILHGQEGINVVSLTCTDSDGNAEGTQVTYTIDLRTQLEFDINAIDGARNIYITWEQSTDEDTTHYNIYSEEEDFTNVSLLDPAFTIYESGRLDYTLSYLTPGTRYYIAVTAADGDDDQLEIVQTKNAVVWDAEAHKPSMPKVLYPNGGEDIYPPEDKAIDIRWEASIDPDGDPITYMVQAEYNDGVVFIAGNVSGTHHIWNSENYNAGQYKISIKAIDAGTIYSDPDQSDDFFTLSHIEPQEPEPLAFDVHAIDKTRDIYVNWSKTKDTSFDHYNVYIQLANFTDISGIEPMYRFYLEDKLDVTLGFLLPNTRYFIAVTETDIDGKGITSVDTKSAVVWDAEAHKPSMPKILYPNGGEFFAPPLDRMINITWEPAVDPDGDAVTYMLHATNGTDLLYIDMDITGTDYMWDCADFNNGRYKVGVKAIDIGGTNYTNIDFSDDYFILTHIPDLGEPRVIAFDVESVVGSPGIYVNWTKTTDQLWHHYNVYSELFEYTDVSDLEAVFATTEIDRQNLTLGLPSPGKDYAPGETYYVAVTEVDMFGKENMVVQTKAATIWDTEAHKPSKPRIIYPNGGEYIEPPYDELINISWEEAVDPDGDPVTYVLEYTDDMTSHPILSDIIGTNYAWPTWNLPEGQYKIGIKAIDECGLNYTDIDLSDDFFVLAHSTDYPPGIVQGLAVYKITGTHHLNISWDEIDITDFKEYDIYRSDTRFDNISDMYPIMSINKKTKTYYEDMTTDIYSRYYYAITATDMRNQESHNFTIVSMISADDVLPQIIFTTSIPKYLLGEITLSAEVTDVHSGLRGCEICITDDDSCDTWTPAIMDNDEDGKVGTCSYIWDTDGLPLDTYLVRFRVSDNEGNLMESSSKNTTVIDQTSALEAQIQLYQGWNMFSVPFIPESNTLTYIMRDIINKYDKIYHYDAESGTWMIFNPRRSVFDPKNSLFRLEPGKGYWIKMNDDAILTVRGYELPEFSMTLYPGWNYIGYPYNEQVTVKNALGDVLDSTNIMYEYISLEKRYLVYEPQGSFNTLTYISGGKGYAIEMLMTDEWVVER